jgi:ribosomal protein S18 acetylase RimI-like enzyme
MTELHFRVARIGDSAEIAQLVNEAYRPAPGMGGWTHESDLVSGERINSEKIGLLIKQEGSTILVGVLGSIIVACVHIEKEGANGCIGMLAVSPSLQGLGKGKEVLAHAEEYAINNFGSNSFVLIVVAARAELISFYLRRGYKKTGTTMQYPLNAGVGTPKFDALQIETLHKAAC